MRLIANVEVPEDRTKHKEYLQSFIYRCIEEADADFAAKLYSSTNIKMFSFSDVMSDRKSKRNFFYVGFAEDSVASMFAAGYLKTSKNASLTSVNQPRFTGRNFVFQTMSPVVVKQRDIYITPEHQGYNDLLLKNILKKYSILTGKQVQPDSLRIRWLEYKKQLYFYKAPVRCVSGVFVLSAQGSEGVEIIKTVYDAGFGEKNSAGFGLCRLIDCY